MAVTTIKLGKKTKEKLNEFKQYKNESYDEVVRKLLYVAKMVKKKPQLSKKTIIEIEEARKRIKRGEFYTEEEMRKRLGL